MFWLDLPLLLCFALVVVALLALFEVWRFSRVDSWYRRFDRGAPWRRRSWGFA